MLRFYFSIFLTIFSLHLFSQDLPELDFKEKKRLFSKNDFEPGPIFNAAIGFNKSNFQLDVSTISYRFKNGLEPHVGFGILYNLTEIPLSNLDKSANFINAHLTGGLKYNFFDTPVTPYVKAGGGIGFSSLANDEYLDSNMNGSFIADVGIGLMITPKDTYSIFIEANQNIMRLSGRHTLSNGNEFIYRTINQYLFYRIGLSIYLNNL